MRATYLYGITAGEPSDLPGRIDLPGESAEVRVVSVDGLFALVSDYDGPPAAEMSQETLLRLLISHQRVLEAVSGQHPLLPAKLGTLLDSEDMVRELLSRFGSRLRAALEDVGDAIEVDLSATWDLSNVLAEISAMPDLAEAVQALNERPADETLAARVHIGQVVQERVQARREEYRRRIVGDLTRLVRDAQPNPRPTDEVVFNVAFLVERDGLQTFDDAVDRVGEELAGRLDLRYVGPLPPYSFGTIQITRPVPAEIDAARDLLGLGESVTRQDVQRAYRQRAAQMHPDVNRQDPLAEQKFAGLTAAHRMLTAYIRGSDGTGDASSVALTEDAVRSAVLLEIVRGETETMATAGAPA